MKSYGITKKSEVSDKVGLHLESISIKGFSIEESFFGKEECEHYKNLLEKVYTKQLEGFSATDFEAISELDIARMPFLYEKEFINIFMNPFILKVCEGLIGTNFQLHLQNGIINRGNKVHHQTSWHRDLPYQDWVISKPLGFNAFICLTDFTKDNGATLVLPHSHRIEYFPSNAYVDANKVQVIAPLGSVVFFDSMIYHCASLNKTNETRYGLNNMYVSPILKQQINIPHAYGDNHKLTEMERKIMGYNYQVPDDVNDFRKKRLAKLKK